MGVRPKQLKPQQSKAVQACRTLHHERLALLRVTASTGVYLLAMTLWSAQASASSARTLALSTMSLLCVGITLYIRRLVEASAKRARHRYWLLGVNAAWCCMLVSTAVLFHPGLHAATVMLPFGLGLFVIAKSMRWAIGASLASVMLWLQTAAYVGGSLAPEVEVLDSYMLCTLTLVWILGTTLLMALRASRQSKRALANLALRERELATERQSNERARAEIEMANQRLNAQREELERQLEEDAHMANLLAEQADKEVVIAEGVHQYLSEPLRNVVSFAQLIRRKVAKQEEAQQAVGEYVAYIEDGALRMARMLADLRMYTQNDADTEPEAVDLNDLLTDLSSDLSGALERTNGTLSIGHLPSVMGFPTQLVRLFQNLIANALKFGRADQPVRVCISGVERQDSYVIRVSDNGIGIPANQLDKVFGLFNRAHDQANYEGSGVGLALCQRIALAHDATLTVESEEGVGSTFFIAFSANSVCPSRALGLEPATTHQHV